MHIKLTLKRVMHQMCPDDGCTKTPLPISSKTPSRGASETSPLRGHWWDVSGLESQALPLGQPSLGEITPFYPRHSSCWCIEKCRTRTRSKGIQTVETTRAGPLDWLTAWVQEWGRQDDGGNGPKARKEGFQVGMICTTENSWLPTLDKVRKFHPSPMSFHFAKSQVRLCFSTAIEVPSLENIKNG